MVYASLMLMGVFSRRGNRGAAAAVCRDDQGIYMGLSSVTFTGILDAPTLEVLVCREALVLALDLQIRKVLVCSDCSTAVKEVKAGEGG